MTRCIVNRPTQNNAFEHFFDNFFNDSFRPTFVEPEVSSFDPKVNIVDNTDSIDLTFELPGMEKGDIKVLVKDSLLTISGERKVETEVKSDNYVRSEIKTGKFSRSFNLPDSVEASTVSADYKNGLLYVVLNKKEEKKPKEIEVQIS